MCCSGQSPSSQNMGFRAVPLPCRHLNLIPAMLILICRNIQCDINVNNSLAIENTRLVKLYVDIDERVRPLAMIIKYWAKSRLLNDAAGGGTLTSYTWILMVINFLQTRDPPILPSLHKIPHRQRMSNGIDVGFYDDIPKLKDFGAKNEETLGGLLYAFFVKYFPPLHSL